MFYISLFDNTSTAERIITILDEVVPKSFRLQWDILKAAFGYGDETS